MTKYSQQMVKGMLQLLSNCPAETAHLRKELLIAAKHILTTELRNRTSVLPLAARLSVNVGLLLAGHRVLSLQPAPYFWLHVSFLNCYFGCIFSPLSASLPPPLSACPSLPPSLPPSLSLSLSLSLSHLISELPFLKHRWAVAPCALTLG